MFGTPWLEIFTAQAKTKVRQLVAHWPHRWRWRRCAIYLVAVAAEGLDHSRQADRSFEDRDHSGGRADRTVGAASAARGAAGAATAADAGAAGDLETSAGRHLDLDAVLVVDGRACRQRRQRRQRHRIQSATCPFTKQIKIWKNKTKLNVPKKSGRYRRLDRHREH